jgi:hypothetical protein
MLSRFLSPEAALAVVVGACFLIELAQYHRPYDARYDPFDLVAYASLVVPCYVVDRWLVRRHARDVRVAG